MAVWKIAAFGRINVDEAGAPVIGEVQASPTSNTVLDRLKTIATNITNLATTIVLATGSAIIGRVGHDTTGLGHGVKTVTTAGTDVALAASTAVKWLIVQAQTDNTDKVAVGASGVDATVATGTGILLDPGDTIPVVTDNLADVFVDALVAGEGVRYFYGT